MLKAVCAGVIILLTCGLVGAAESPVDQGSYYLGGSIYFKSQSGDLWENSEGDGITTFGVGDGNLTMTESFEVGPTFGYFVSPGVFLGGQLAIIGLSRGDFDLTVFAVGPTVGYYFDTDPTRTEIRGAVYPYIRGFFNYGKASNGNDVDILQYGAKGGLLYMLSSAVAADVMLRFQGDSWKPDGADESTTGTTLSVGVGISAFIY